MAHKKVYKNYSSSKKEIDSISLSLCLLLYGMIMSGLMGCSAETRDWRAAQEVNNIEVLEEYLEKYPDGKFSDDARASIENLKTALEQCLKLKVTDVQRIIGKQRFFRSIVLEQISITDFKPRLEVSMGSPNIDEEFVRFNVAVRNECSENVEFQISRLAASIPPTDTLPLWCWLDDKQHGGYYIDIRSLGPRDLDPVDSIDNLLMTAVPTGAQSLILGFPSGGQAQIIIGHSPAREAKNMGCVQGEIIGSNSTEEFCNIARTSKKERSETEIDLYYQQLEEAAPSEIRDDVATLRVGWKQVSFSLEEMLSGDISNIQRPPEVSEAAWNVFRYVSEACEFDGGVYLIFPEAGP